MAQKTQEGNEIHGSYEIHRVPSGRLESWPSCSGGGGRTADSSVELPVGWAGDPKMQLS